MKQAAIQWRSQAVARQAAIQWTAGRGGARSVRAPPGARLRFPLRRRRSVLAQHVNPWPGLASCTGGEELARRVETYATTFGIVSALMCGLSAAALAATPVRSEEPGQRQQVQCTGAEEQEGRARAQAAVPHARSLLIGCGVPPALLEDLYIGACASSFYSGMCGLGLSTVALAWNAVTPAQGAAAFVVRHSRMLVGIPFFTAASVGLSGAAMFVGVDLARGRPLSYIGLGGTAAAGLMVFGATGRGMQGAHRAIATARAGLRPPSSRAASAAPSR